ncbi:MAG: IS630 family transposase [Actinobacteria bacterium]|nr:IS630 family transposase [Actinomycetota bacterium]
MAERDARSLPQAAQEELRRRAVKLVSEGHKQVAVAEFLGVARQAVGRWVKAHREGGEQALAAGRRGRRAGEKTALAPWQQAQIAKAIREKNPDQLKLPGFLWTRALVCDLIEQRFEIQIAEKTAGRYLRSWGFSPQKPVKRAYEQSEPKVQKWLTEVYPAIKAKAKKDGAEILWGDEMGLRSDHTTGTTWSPVGQTPVVKGTGKRFKTNMIAVVSNTGTLRFRVFSERFTGPVFLDFIKRLIKDAKGRKIVLIVDGHPAHRAKIVRQWIAEHPDRIELHFLPGYAPELNPAECLNNDVKSNALGRRRPRTLQQLVAETRSYLRSHQRQPWRVARYFQEHHVTYAAA